MSIEINKYNALILCLLTCFSCTQMKGVYAVKLNCGSSAIKFINSEEFILYTNSGYDYKESWNYGTYSRKNKVLILEYKSIPKNLQYESDNRIQIKKEKAIKDSLELKIKAEYFDESKLETYQITLINRETKYITGKVSYSGEEINLKVPASKLPLEATVNIMGGNEIKFEISEMTNHTIDIVFDKIPMPAYGKMNGLMSTMLIRKDSIGKYIISEESKTEEESEKYKYYKK